MEYESREWMFAFNLYLGLGSVFDFLVNWFGIATASEKAIVQGAEDILVPARGKDWGEEETAAAAASAASLYSAAKSTVTSHESSQSKSMASNTNDNSSTNKEEVILPSVQDVLEQVLVATYEWQEWYLEDVHILHISSFPDGTIDVYPPPILYSFHIFLHRFLASCIRESCKHTHLLSTLNSIQQEMKLQPLQVNIIIRKIEIYNN